jgi:hypothetical protein
MCVCEVTQKNLAQCFFLFYNIINISIALRVENYNMKSAKERGRGLIEALNWLLPGKTEGNHDSPSKDIRFPGRGSNLTNSK